MDSLQTDYLQQLSRGAAHVMEYVPKVLQDPRAYPQESFILASIVALALLILMLFTLVLMDVWNEQNLRRAVGVRRNTHRSLLPTATVIAALCCLLTALALVPLVPRAGEACSSCHAMDEAVASWNEDLHRGVSCYACHSTGGIFGALQTSSAGAFRLITSRDTTVSVGGLFENRCLDCHDDLSAGVTDGDVRMRHSDVIRAGYDCLGCHPTVGHATDQVAEAAVRERSRMSICLLCHDGVKASSDCTTCHDHAPSDVAGTKAAASTDAPQTCKGCHTEETDRGCVSCHGLELPHPPAFFGDHAELSADNPSLCARCHEAAGRSGPCDCHPDTNTHGTYNEWFPLHGPMATSVWPGGCRCHAESFCLMCHEDR